VQAGRLQGRLTVVIRCPNRREVVGSVADVTRARETSLAPEDPLEHLDEVFVPHCFEGAAGGPPYLKLVVRSCPSQRFHFVERPLRCLLRTSYQKAHSRRPKCSSAVRAPESTPIPLTGLEPCFAESQTGIVSSGRHSSKECCLFCIGTSTEAARKQFRKPPWTSLRIASGRTYNAAFC